MSLQPNVPTASPEQSGPHLASAASSNGSALATPSRLPSARRGKGRARFILPASIILLLLGGVVVWAVWFRGPSVRTDLVAIKVERQKLIQLKIVERGTLEAKENHYIVCEVKPGSRGVPKIKEVVDNGTLVKGPVFSPTKLFGAFPIATKLGDEIVVIDDSSLVEQATNQRIARDKAEADMIAAELLYPGKLTAIDLAKRNKDKWVEGDFPQQKHDLEGQIETAVSNLLQEEDRMAWVSRMVKKTYMTASQEEAERALLSGNELDVKRKKELLTVLIKYTNETNLQSLDNAILDAVNAEKTAKSDMLIKQAVFKQQDDLYKDLLDQIAQCRVRAPHSGIVVYTVPEQTRMGSGSNQSIIAQGEPVGFGQKMMSIPDLSHMLVNVRIHEAFIGHVNVKARIEKVFEGGAAEKAGLQSRDIITRMGDRPIDFYPDLIEALTHFQPGEKVKLRVMRDKKEMEIELTFSNHASSAKRGTNTDPTRHFGAKFQAGLPATIRVDAAPGRVLRGHVASVQNVAAQQDWMSPDVKVYQAYVEIDEPVQELKLKPGLSAVCTIFTETQAENVLAVPVQTILPATERGGDPRVLVMSPEGPKSRTVKLLKIDGKLMSDDKYVAVEEGLKEDEEVIENPKTALGDKEKGKKAPKDNEKAAPDAKSDQPDPGKKGKPPGKGPAVGQP